MEVYSGQLPHMSVHHGRGVREIRGNRSISAMALYCVILTRLNYISHTTLSCMFPVRMSHKRDLWEMCRTERKEQSFLAHTLLLIC